MNDFEVRIEELNNLIKNSNKITFFGGAGVSTESGIPDFRSKDGLYNTPNVGFEDFTPEYLLSRTCLKRNADVFFEFYRQKLDCRNVEPNITHYKLAEMEKSGKLNGVITQNIDGLHQKAGSNVVAELHGTTFKNYCSKCGKVYDKDYIFSCKDSIPRCDCGGIIRPDVTLYEEQLPDDAWNLASCLLNESDLLIIGGTSLTVYPACNLVKYYNKKIVLINRDSTQFDSRAGLIFNESLGVVFSKIEL